MFYDILKNILSCKTVYISYLNLRCFLKLKTKKNILYLNSTYRLLDVLECRVGSVNTIVYFGCLVESKSDCFFQLIKYSGCYTIFQVEIF